MSLEIRTPESIFASLKSFLQQINAKVKDFNTGSIISSILSTVSKSIGNLYTQLETILKAAFVSTAENGDLDLRVADFTLTRNPATKATIQETFFTTTFSPAVKTIAAGTIITTAPSTTVPLIQYITPSTVLFDPTVIGEQFVFEATVPSYNLSHRQTFSITEVRGTLASVPNHIFTPGVDYNLDTSIPSQAKVVWVFSGPTPVNDVPDDATIFFVDSLALSVDVSAEAVSPGSLSRVSAGALNTLQSLPIGIDGAINYVSSTGGDDEQTDESLRQAVRDFLASLSRATAPSLIARTLQVPGVEGAEIIEPFPPMGFVVAIPDDGTGGASESLQSLVLDALNGTSADNAVRAAGIIVSVSAPHAKNIDITGDVTAVAGADPDIIKEAITSSLRDYFDTLFAGKTVIRAKIAAAITDTTNVTNLDLSNLLIQTEELPIVGGLTGDILIPKDFKARLGVVTINII